MNNELNESEEPFKGVELNEEKISTDLNKSHNKYSLKCKLISSLFIILIIFFIFLIIIFTKKETIVKDHYAKIVCIYNVLNHFELLPILSPDFPDEELEKMDFYVNFSYYEKKSKSINISSNGIIEINFLYHKNSKIFLENIFKDISNLLSVTISATNNTKLYSIKSAFESCENLENVTIKGFDTSEVTSMSKMFYNNSNLTNINLDDNFRTDKVEDMSFMFYMSSSSKINTNNFVTNKVKNMSHMFSD